MVIVVLYEKIVKVLAVIYPNLVNELLWRDPELLGFQHCSRTVSVVGTDVDALVTSQFLITNPNVRLDVLEQMTEMYCAVGVRQRAGHKNSPHNFEIRVLWCAFPR